MTITEQYTRTHEVLKEYARRLELLPFDVRVLLAVAEHGDFNSRSATYEQLYAVLDDGGAAVRRSALALRKAGLVVIERKDGSFGSGRGVGSRARLTQPGVRLVRRLVVDCHERGEIAA